MAIHATDIPEAEIEITAIRASGPGGQNVNKVSTAIHLRFDIMASSLPGPLKARLAALKDHRITSDGVIVIKAQRSRSQEKNRVDALERLDDLLQKAQVVARPRRPTKPTRSSVKQRLDDKTARGKQKKMRKSVDDDY